MSFELARDPPETGPFALVGARWRIDIQPRLALFAALLVVAPLPVLVTPNPAMVDYTNHLARMYLLTSLAASSGPPFYHLAPASYPNLAMDMLETPQVERRFALYRIRKASLASRRSEEEARPRLAAAA